VTSSPRVDARREENFAANPRPAANSGIAVRRDASYGIRTGTSHAMRVHVYSYARVEKGS
jgi:hypothetical protein